MGITRNWIPFIILLSLLFSCNSTTDKQNKINLLRDTAFHSSSWKKGDIYLRGRMMNALMANGALENISKDSLITILGIPMESGDGFCNYLVSAEDSSISQNYLLLHISSDSANTVTEYGITD